MEPDTRTPEQIAADREFLIHLGRAEEAMAKRDALAATITASDTPRGQTGSHVERMAAAQGRATPSPERGRRPGGFGGPSSAAVVTAAISGGGVAAGQALAEPTELAELMAETLSNMDRRDFGRRHIVAKARWEYPPERRLDDSIDGNTAKIDRVCGLNAPRYDRKTGALTAAGGICLPTGVDFSIPTWSSTDRVLRDSLPAFQATRGGVQFMSPPDIGVPDLQGGTASGVGEASRVWSEATDASPAGQTKPVYSASCGSPVTVYVDAIPSRVEFSNMSARFMPEMLAATTQQAIATAAREAELNLLAKMFNASKQVLPSQYLGASRDLLTSADLLAQQYRYSHRISETTTLTAVLPAWAKAVIRSDRARELAHDSAGSTDVMAISDAEIDQWFSVRGIDVIWVMEGLQGGTYGIGGHSISDQYFPLATAGAQPQWPGQSTDGAFTLAWLLFVTGTFQFLDGGRLDLGVVRDSLLDASNQFETFVETFEGIADRGVESYQILSTILPNGGSAGSVAESGYHE